MFTVTNGSALPLGTAGWGSCLPHCQNQPWGPYWCHHTPEQWAPAAAVPVPQSCLACRQVLAKDALAASSWPAPLLWHGTSQAMGSKETCPCVPASRCHPPMGGGTLWLQRCRSCAGMLSPSPGEAAQKRLEICKTASERGIKAARGSPTRELPFCLRRDLFRGGAGSVPPTQLRTKRSRDKKTYQNNKEGGGSGERAVRSKSQEVMH
ncbi:uncharacterized protein LOC133220312 [Neopsephotus bourkii]|uniref:uncharacterized protein LOC133220312 n=1 Tax=Neopsephotus bourkii TaxID=309878 RepID=UPI002AA5367D|nr:uncharacterized protein LOC133220312 [Neopsephotus bourkii]